MFRKKFYFVVTLLVLLVAGFLATSLTSYYLAQDSIANQISEQTLPLTSDNIYSEIQRDLLRPVLISSLMATDTFLRDWALGGETDAEPIRMYLAEIQERYGTITAFFVSDHNLNYYHPTGVVRQVDVNDPADAWYFRVRQMRAPYEINIDNDTVDRSQLNIFINYRVLDYAGNYIGATGVGLAVNSVTRLIDEYQQRYGRTIYFIDRLGNVTLTGSSGAGISEQRLQDRPGLGELALQVLSNPGVSLTWQDADGTDIFLNSRLVPEFDWYLVVEQRGNSAASGLRNTLWINIALGLGIMALVSFAAHFALKAYQGQLEEMATTDRLTGLANRHVFETLFAQVTKLSLRNKRPVTLVSMDIDHFKQVNDTFGHPGGDVVLKVVADIIKAHIRASDVVCRWGGEEFLLLLNDCTLDQAMARTNTLLDAIRQQTIPFGREGIRVTLSAGLAQHHRGETLASLASRADIALYAAKGQGRDRVCATA